MIKNSQSRRFRFPLIIGLCSGFALLFFACAGGPNLVRGPEDLSLYRFDRDLELELVEIISGETGLVRFDHPVSAALTVEQHLVILQNNPPRLLMLDTNRRLVSQTGAAGSGSARLREPRFVRSGFGLSINVADLGGQLYIYDTRLRFIDSFSPAWTATEFPGGSPSGLVISAFGDTYLADRDNDIIYQFDPGGRFQRTIGGADAGAGRLHRPGGLALTERGVLVVCDPGGQRLVLFDEYGEYQTSLGDGYLADPLAAATAPDQDAVFVFDGATGELSLYSLTDELLKTWTGFDLVPGGIGRVTDLFIDHLQLYLVDAGKNRLYRFVLLPVSAD